jgi:hypothetical protein
MRSSLNITNLGDGHDPSTNKPYKLRTVTIILDNDHFTLVWFRTNDAAKEEKVVSMAHSRKKPRVTLHGVAVILHLIPALNCTCSGAGESLKAMGIFHT